MNTVKKKEDWGLMRWLMSKDTWHLPHKPDNLSSFHVKIEGENGLHKAVFGPPHVCHGTHTYHRQTSTK